MQFFRQVNDNGKQKSSILVSQVINYF